MAWIVRSAADFNDHFRGSFSAEPPPIITPTVSPKSTLSPPRGNLIQNNIERLVLIGSFRQHLHPQSFFFEHGFTFTIILPNNIKHRHLRKTLRSLLANRNLKAGESG